MPTVPPPRRGRPPKHSRPLLLNAASVVLIQRGYGALRYRDVAEQAAVPVASLQHYFPNLAALRREALLNQVHSEMGELAVDLDRTSDPWRRLRSIVVSSIDLDPMSRQAEWLLWLEYWRAASHEQDLADDSEKTYRKWLDLIETTLGDGVDRQIFRPAAEVREIAVTLAAMINGFGIRIAVNGGQETAEGGVDVIESYLRRVLDVDEDAESFRDSSYSPLA
ncbi:MAG: TetR/AcrR family transcriptional regulator [Nocardioides sp.]